jgi:hypothetical protein
MGVRKTKAGGGVKFCAHITDKAKVYPPGIVLGAKAACCSIDGYVSGSDLAVRVTVMTI